MPEQGKQEAANDGPGQLSLQLGADHFHLERANVLISPWSRVPDALEPMAGRQTLAGRVAMWFRTSKPGRKMPVGSTCGDARVAAVIRRCHSPSLRQAERVRNCVPHGDPAGDGGAPWAKAATILQRVSERTAKEAVGATA